MLSTPLTASASSLQMQPNEAPALADFVVVNAICKRLELSYNSLGPVGATTLCNALKENRRIEGIVISSNR